METSPSYSPEIATEICKLLSEGWSLRKVCREPLMPSEGTVRAWVRDDYGKFAAQYARARDIGYAALEEDILEISDDSSLDRPSSTDESGNTVVGDVDQEHIQRSRLRVDTRKWLLSKVLPKRYGERLAHEVSGPDGAPIKIDDTTAATKLMQIFNAVLARRPPIADGSDLV